jgi:hypothetical protein
MQGQPGGLSAHNKQAKKGYEALFFILFSSQLIKIPGIKLV